MHGVYFIQFNQIDQSDLIDDFCKKLDAYSQHYEWDTCNLVILHYLYILSCLLFDLDFVYGW